MANQSLPIKPHFFQPLLPDFRTHLNIPVAFFKKHVEGRNNQNKTAKLRSDASVKTWLVKMDGLTFTDGWEDFAFAHNLRTGDIVVFKHEGEMVFHVTALGPSCCEIKYTSSHNIEDDSNDQINIASGNSSRKKRVKENPIKKVESSLDQSSFVSINVSATSLRSDQMYLPRDFARSNGLDKMSGERIVLLDEEGKSWKFNLKYNPAGKHTFARPGWESFCIANGMSQGQEYTFKLVKQSGTPVMRLCLPERPKSGDDSSISEESEKESTEDKNISQGFLEIKKRKYCSRASSSYSQDRFVTLTLTLSPFQTYKLFLPRDFTEMNGINKPGKLTLLGQDGVKRVVDLFQDKSGTMRFGKGWKEFCKAHGVKIDESFVLKLIWEDEASPVLKICTKVNST